MNNKFFYTISLLFSFLSLTPALAQTVVWDESVDGDLPGDITNLNPNTLFQAITLVDGVNIIKGSAANASHSPTQPNIDALSFTIPSGASVTDITVSSFILQNENTTTSFSGFIGTPLVSTAGTHGFQVVNTAGTSLLPNYGGGPLLSGHYGIMVGEGIIEGSLYEISITCTGCPPAPASNPEVPTLSEWGLIVLALLLMTAGTLVLVQPSTRFEQEL